MGVPRLRFFGVVICFLFLAATACKTAPKALAPDAQMNVEQLLHAYSDRDELSGFVGTPPAICTQDTPRTELCEWQVNDRLAGWQPLAQVIATRDRVNLICELHLSGATREPGSCTAHPRRSNRASWQTAGKRAGRASTTASERAEIVEGNRRLAEHWMAQADTLLRMSRLMGAVPSGCGSRSAVEQACSWHTTAQTFGHGILAVWIDASRSKKIILRCTFPKDGGPRALDSCHAQIGA
jgi:hypothetical protein